jgi:hypothetical protein
MTRLSPTSSKNVIIRARFASSMDMASSFVAPRERPPVDLKRLAYATAVAIFFVSYSSAHPPSKPVQQQQPSLEPVRRVKQSNSSNKVSGRSSRLDQSRRRLVEVVVVARRQEREPRRGSGKPIYRPPLAPSNPPEGTERKDISTDDPGAISTYHSAINPSWIRSSTTARLSHFV